MQAHPSLIGTVWFDPSWDDHLLVVDEDEGEEPGTLVSYLNLDGPKRGSVEQMSKAMLVSMERVA